MGWSQVRQRGQAEPQAASSQAGGAAQFRDDPPSKETSVTAADLVYQAAEVIQGIEDYAVEFAARGRDLSRRAAEQLHSAEAKIREFEASQRASDVAIKEAEARAQEAEQLARAAQGQLASMVERLSSADQRIRNAEARAVEAEKALIRVADAIRNQLLANQQTSTKGRLAAA